MLIEINCVNNQLVTVYNMVNAINISLLSITSIYASNHGIMFNHLSNLYSKNTGFFYRWKIFVHLVLTLIEIDHKYLNFYVDKEYFIFKNIFKTFQQYMLQKLILIERTQNNFAIIKY